jgi:hypothetical protein
MFTISARLSLVGRAAELSKAVCPNSSTARPQQIQFFELENLPPGKGAYHL